ncbi:MAG: hypothetical protein ACK4GT_07620 [Pararhodobacter sp.]
MLIDRFALAAAQPVLNPRERPRCLGCADCTGTCWSLLELDLLPDTVLHPRTRRA